MVSAYPPSTAPLSEYAGHLVTALCASDRVDRVCMLSDRAPGATSHTDGKTEVIPCWTFGTRFLAAPVIRAARSRTLDVLWFNIHLTSTGNTRGSWFGGMCAPAIARAAGFRVIVTLHNMLGLTDLTHAAVRAKPWDIQAAHLVTRSLRHTDAVCVLRPEYVALLAGRYRVPNVFYVPHGTLGTPIASVRPNDGTDVLAFGHFGSYKRLEPLVEAIDKLSRAGLPVRLTIGGTDSRHAPGYLSALKERYRQMKNIRFLGYVPEADVPALFQAAAICVLPYATMAGMSGVAILAAMHGAPIVAPDIDAFRALEREGLRMRFFRWADATDLAQALADLLNAPDERRRLAGENLLFVGAQRMPDVVTRYLDIITAVARTKAAPSSRAGDR
jgi:glycosyltransferase involved in cell wall biosynthesis